MVLPKSFISEDNFRLAFTRVVRGSNSPYKHFYRHLLPAYNAALPENLADLIDDLKRGRYVPSPSTLVYQPKRSGVLRPLALLTLRDLIVYQAVVNIVAEKMWTEQSRYAGQTSFGSVYAGKASPFFFRSWKKSYELYSRDIEKNYKLGYEFVADFDLVSCYELIDHSLLRSRVEPRVKSPELLDLLLRCLSVWTTNASGRHLRHGVPQGPEASAFLAECLLLRFDALRFKNVKYLRYVDDVRLMAKSETPLRRALLKLDLESKDLGLVPQAQKILVRKVSSLDEVIKSIPSGLASADAFGQRLKQRDLIATFRSSLQKRNKKREVVDETKFKYSLLRLNPRRDVLRRIAPLLVGRPDISWVLSMYLKKFPGDREAADILLEALRLDPAYDNAAAHYIEAMDICEPSSKNTKYRRVIRTAMGRSEEKSITLRIASLTFRGKRVGPKAAVRLVDVERDARVRGILINRLFADEEAPHRLSQCSKLLESDASHADEDYSRFAAYLRLYDSKVSGSPWKIPTGVNRSTKLLLVGMGLRRRAPSKRNVIDRFFESRGVRVSFPWRKALQSDFTDAERRCVRLQRLLLGDPTARIMMLDTFNELLIQRFSQKHPSLAPKYSRAAGSQPHPDYGAWLNHTALARVLSVGISWFQEVHRERVQGDLAHAKGLRGRYRGKPTRAIDFKKAERLLLHAVVPWRELVRIWQRHV